MTSSLLDIIVRSSGGSLANPLAKFKDVQTLHVIIHALTLEGTASGQTIDEQSPQEAIKKPALGICASKPRPMRLLYFVFWHDCCLAKSLVRFRSQRPLVKAHGEKKADLAGGSKAHGEETQI